MPLEDLPFDVFHGIFENLKDLHGTYSETLRVLRLTSKALNAMATVALFDCVVIFVHFPRSWELIQHIAHQEKIAENVKSLSLDISKYSPGSAKNEKGFHGGLDLGLFPNLSFISINRDEFRLQRRRSAKASRKAYRVTLAKKPWNTPFWSIKLKPKVLKKFISELVKVAFEYGFEFDMFQLSFPSLDQNTRNMILPALDLRCLKSLKLGAWYIKTRTQRKELNKMLPALHHLPALVYLTLQDGLHPVTRGDEYRWRCNIIEMLKNQHWPSVKHLQIELPRTKLATLQAFLLLYKGQLQTLHLHGACPTNEKIETVPFPYCCYDRDYIPLEDECGSMLKTWIRDNISPEEFTTSSGKGLLTPLTLRGGQIQECPKQAEEGFSMEMNRMTTWAGKDLWWCSDWEIPW